MTPAGWGVALIVIVIVSWFFYRFAAPRRWREWTRAGLVQAFIIALYAEMYGFPLTIYLLVRVFGVDADTTTGNLWSSLFRLGELPMFVAMIVGYTLVVAGAGMLIKGWREVYKAHRERRLAQTGLYGVVRHPQYTGILLALFGEGIVHWPTVFSVALYPVILVAYVLLARKEEKEMLREFGDEYRAYQERVPRFLPGGRQLLVLLGLRRPHAPNEPHGKLPHGSARGTGAGEEVSARELQEQHHE